MWTCLWLRTVLNVDIYVRKKKVSNVDMSMAKDLSHTETYVRISRVSHVDMFMVMDCV